MRQKQTFPGMNFALDIKSFMQAFASVENIHSYSLPNLGQQKDNARTGTGHVQVLAGDVAQSQRLTLAWLLSWPLH
jgi:hypothetical protein